MTTQQIDQQQAEQAGQAAFALFGMLSGAWAARVLQVAAELCIADALKDGPKTIEELAAATETHAPSLQRLMRALASLGVFAQPQKNVYAMSPLSWHLVKKHPGSMREFIMFFKQDWSWKLWCELTYAIKTGGSGMRHAYGKNIWEYCDESP